MCKAVGSGPSIDVVLSDTSCKTKCKSEENEASCVSKRRLFWNEVEALMKQKSTKASAQKVQNACADAYTKIVSKTKTMTKGPARKNPTRIKRPATKKKK